MTKQSDAKEAVLERFRVESITEGAIRAIARKGAAVTMQDIADESGIAKGTLYLYFKDRDELLQRVSRAGLAQLMRSLDDVFARSLSFEDTVRELILTKMRFFDARRDLYRVQFELQYASVPDAECKVKEKTPPPEKEAYVARLTEYFAPFLEDPAEAPRLARYFSEVITAVLFKRIPETSVASLADDAGFLAEMMLHGLSAKRKKS